MTSQNFDVVGMRRVLPVSSKTCLSFQDYESMHTHTRKQAGERRLPTPEWALNDKLLRERLVAFMEARYQIQQCTGTLAKRIKRCRAKALARRPALEATVNRLNRAYVAETDPARRRELEVEIENFDTTVRIMDKGLALVAAVVYFYYRCCLDSVAVAEETGIKPPHVRAMLYRLNHLKPVRQPTYKPREVGFRLSARPELRGKRRRRTERIRKGLCGDCGKVALVPGRKSCRACLDHYAALAAKSRLAAALKKRPQQQQHHGSKGQAA